MSTHSELDGCVAVVTGAASGIGKAVAEALAAAGAAVVVNFRSKQEAAERMVGAIRERGGRALAVQADVSDEAQVQSLFEQAAQAFGGIDILCANAGVQKDAPIADMTLDQWRAVLDVDLAGQFLCCREAIRHFRRGGDRSRTRRCLGSIVCMSSVHQHIPWAGHANYAAAKGGVRMLMQTLAQEVGRDRIRVNAIAPGAIATDINHAVWSDPQQRAKLLELIPYGRIGEVEDIARAAVWLSSDAADYVTGTTLIVDGGMSLYPGFIGNG